MSRCESKIGQCKVQLLTSRYLNRSRAGNREFVEPFGLSHKSCLGQTKVGGYIQELGGKTLLQLASSASVIPRMACSQSTQYTILKRTIRMRENNCPVVRCETIIPRRSFGRMHNNILSTPPDTIRRRTDTRVYTPFPSLSILEANV